jgi:hypothetical protein
MLSGQWWRSICWTLSVSALLVLATVQGVIGAQCSGATYDSTAFEEEVTQFSPYDTIYLIISCSDLVPGEHIMHVNWVHNRRGVIRSDKHDFIAETPKKRGIYFWFKLSKKGPMASMFTNQDFHEENFGEWSVETYLDDKPLLTKSFTIEDGIQ